MLLRRQQRQSGKRGDTNEVPAARLGDALPRHWARRSAICALATGALLAIDLAMPGAVMSVQAQQQPRLVLNVAPVMLVEPASKSPFPIQVGPQEVLLKNSFVRIRGLPPAASLSEGHAISPGAWAVPLAGLLNLGVVLPVGLQGRWDVVVAVVTIEGTVLTEAKTVLVVGPTQHITTTQPRQDQSSTNVASLGQQPTAVVPPPSPERDRALGMHTKGKELLEQGNVQPARMLFRRAADAGLAESALALGGTYDPVELAKLRVIGLQPDVATARQWYDKARQLGAPEAAERLRRLEGR